VTDPASAPGQQESDIFSIRLQKERKKGLFASS